MFNLPSPVRWSKLSTSPRFRLAILYSAVVGSILLGLAYATHRVMDRISTQTIDRELDLLSTSLSAQFETYLKVPGKLPQEIDRNIVKLCRVNDRCTLALNPSANHSSLSKLIQDDYHLQLLDIQGNAVAAIAERPGRFPKQSNSAFYHTVTDAHGIPYHLHYKLLKTNQGQDWGYLQVGRSVRQFDTYMRDFHLLITLGIPTTMGLLGWASWWVAGVAMRPIYKSYEKMQRFTADASHELRTPIAATRAMLEVAIAQINVCDNTETRQTLVSLQRQNDRIGRLAQDLLLLSRLDLAQQDQAEESPENQQQESICLNELVQDIEEELAPLALAAQVELVSEIQRSKQLYITGNLNQMYRLLSNLISNAIQYTLPQGRVKIQLSHRQNDAIVLIRDTGIGIDKDDLPYLFDRFYRVKDDRSRESGGVGLGLAIARAIAIAHRGQISVQSQRGVGSSFTVKLPLRTPFSK